MFESIIAWLKLPAKAKLLYIRFVVANIGVKIHVKTRKMRVWLYKHLHENDDYQVRVIKCEDIRKVKEIFHTPWFLRALGVYIYWNFKYRQDTVVFIHFRYEKIKEALYERKKNKPS